LALVFLPGLANSPMLGEFMGINLAQFVCFLLFWAMNIYIIYRGIESIKVLETWAAPFLLVIGACMLIWAWWEVGSMGKILDASYTLSQNTNVDFWAIFWPNLTAMIGFWATLSLNIPDFTRYAKSQRDQMLGQALGLPTTMAFYSFIGIAVTSATVLIFGEAIWDPVVLLGKFDSPVVVILSMLGLTIATISTNIAANVVAPANGIASIAPKKISFKMGGYITGVIGVIIFPWKLMADPDGYIFTWLIAYSGLLGAIAGVMISDYYMVRKTQLHLDDLFKENGPYKGWNIAAWASFAFSMIPVIPGFLATVNILSRDTVGDFLADLYSYSWFVTFGLSMFSYYFLNQFNFRKP